MQKYSIFNVIKNAFNNHEDWEVAWKDPTPKEEYDVSTQKQINRSLSGVIEQLNSTYLNNIKEEQERFSWFLSG